MMLWRRFRRHKVGVAGLVFVILAALLVVFAEFFAPYGRNEVSSYVYAPPILPRFVDQAGRFHLRPFVCERAPAFDLETGTTEWNIDATRRHSIRFFVQGSPYNFLFFRATLHLFGAGEGRVFLLGSDALGRDVFSRLLYGGRVSLAVALLTALFALVAGSLAGVCSGYLGGKVDMVIQRVIELFLIVPSIPLGLALAAFLPPDLPPTVLIVGIALVVSFVTWANVARQVRGKALAIRDMDFVQSAVAVGASTPRILVKHVLPPIYSHLIVVATLTIPQAMLAEAGLSFLGFGVRPPMTSWGALLREAQNFRVLALYPWLVVPGLAIALTVLALNFVGDGLRDAADPYSR